MSNQDDLFEETCAALAPMIADFARQLGESPEAWRGASIAMGGLAGIITVPMSDDTLDGDTQVRYAVMAALAAIASITEHPLFRHDLMTDGTVTVRLVDEP